MTERENLPAVIAAQEVAVLTEQSGSLVARGLAALQVNKKSELIHNNQDERYRQARIEYNCEAISNPDFYGIESWSEIGNPALFSAFKVLQQLADENYGKAYYPLSVLYANCLDIKDYLPAQRFLQLAFEWCFANQANQDAELCFDLAEMYEWGGGSNHIVLTQQNAFAQMDNEKAMFWYNKAAEQGSELAQRQLDFFDDLLYGHGP